MSENKKIIQKSVHSKANRTYYKNNTTYSKSGCNNHSDYGYSNHSNTTCNWGIWYDQWGGCSHTGASSSGCDNHTNSGQNNHTNSTYNNVIVAYKDTVDTFKYHPRASAGGVILSKAFVNNVKIPTIYCRWSTGSGTVIRPDFSKFDSSCSKIRFYLRSATTKAGLSSASFSLLGEVNSSSAVYNWNVSNLATDASSLYCQIAITGYNDSWSALLVNGQLTGKDSHEKLSNHTSTKVGDPTIAVTAFTDIAASYMLSDTFKIFFYKPPMYNPDTQTWSNTQVAWKTDPWSKKTIDQLEAEINKARNKVDEATYVFADRPIISNFNFVTASGINADITATDVKASSQTKPSNVSAGNYVNKTAITALQNMLNNFEGK